MALVSDPQVVFLDEPTIGLDPQARRGMWEYIAGLKGNTTIVLTTHYLEEADALADRVAVVDGGALVALGTPAELKAGVEIEADDVSVYEFGDCLRPFGVEIRSTAVKHVSLDDVFLELTGKELRE